MTSGGEQAQLPLGVTWRHLRTNAQRARSIAIAPGTQREPQAVELPRHGAAGVAIDKVKSQAQAPRERQHLVLALRKQS